MQVEERGGGCARGCGGRLGPRAEPIDERAAAATGTTIEVAKPAASPSGAHVATFDYTHLGPRGSGLFSGLVAEEIRRALPGLATHLPR
jgi:hypothetical protein